MLFNLIIVEDEESIRLRIFNYIKNNYKTKFNILTTFNNGYDTLINSQDLNIDLVITDINMPFINGLELIKRMKEDKPLIESLIITGYDDTAYLKEAISLGVIGYLSKPLNYEELDTYLEKSYEILIKKNTEVIKSIQLNSETNEDLNRLVLNKSYDLSLINKLKKENIDLNYYYLSFVSFDFDKENSEINLNEINECFNILNSYIDETFENFKFKHYLFKTTNYYCLILVSDNEIKRETINIKLSEIICFIKKKYNISLSSSFIVVKKEEKFNFYKLYRHSIKALNYRVILGYNIVISYEDISKNKVLSEIDESKIKAITYELNYGDINKSFSLLNNFLNETKDQSFHELYFYYINKLLIELISSCLNKEELFKEYNSFTYILHTLLNYKSNENIYNYLKDLINNIYLININYKRKDIYSSYLQILNFIESNYNDCDFNLDKLQEELNYSTSYISLILKNNNTSFTKVLTDIRMKKALELLNDPNNKISSIANLIGYNDPYYFSHVFKKYYKVSPQEFRKNEKTNN